MFALRNLLLLLTPILNTQLCDADALQTRRGPTPSLPYGTTALNSSQLPQVLT